MQFLENVPLRPKTTMRIGGTARFFGEIATREDAVEAMRFSVENKRKIIPLGSGSNTIFADGVIDALIVRIKHDVVTLSGNRVTVGAGKNLAMLINELATAGLDLSPLTGIPGTVAGAIFGNAGQGPKGIWIDAFVESVTALVDGEWKTFSKNECEFAYRESGFKRGKCGSAEVRKCPVPIIWEVLFDVPSGDPAAIKANIEALLKKRIETQPHLKTAGSCFKAVGDTPAWKLIDAAGLRGYRVGGVEISPKHANFLMNVGDASFVDAVKLVEHIQKTLANQLDVEMRFVEQDGSLRYR